eukprot:4768629-Amphidinium_carterae.1
MDVASCPYTHEGLPPLEQHTYMKLVPQFCSTNKRALGFFNVLVLGDAIQYERCRNFPSFSTSTSGEAFIRSLRRIVPDPQRNPSRPRIGVCQQVLHVQDAVQVTAGMEAFER